MAASHGNHPYLPAEITTTPNFTLNTHPSRSIPFLRHFLWLAATASVFLTGCRESTEDDLSKPLPDIITIPESTADLRALIATELAAGNKRIVIPEGRYRVQAVRGSHLSFRI
jgi:hypothetical protein